MIQLCVHGLFKGNCQDVWPRPRANSPKNTVHEGLPMAPLQLIFPPLFHFDSWLSNTGKTAMSLT